MISFIIIYQTNNEFLIFRSVQLSKKLSAPEQAGEPLSGLQGGKDVYFFLFQGGKDLLIKNLRWNAFSDRLYTMLTN